jgi:hypothetical protein
MEFVAQFIFLAITHIFTLPAPLTDPVPSVIPCP